MAIIEVEKLVKKYKTSVKDKGFKGYLKHLIKPKYQEFNAVNGINFQIQEGELVGYIGENGAGKSTTIKMLTGLLTPTSGKIVVNGLIPYEKRIENNQQIGAVFGQKTSLWWDLPVIHSYELIKQMYQMTNQEYKENLEMFTEVLGLEELLNKQVKNLSLGQKMKCEIAGVFLHNPKIVYLDEPTIGLDVLVKEKIREFIKQINREKNTTVILTTHDLKDIDEVCNRILLIDKGQIIYDGQKESFKNQYAKQITAEFVIENKKKLLTNEMQEEEFEVIEENSNYVKIKFNHDTNTIVTVIDKVGKYCNIKDIHIKEDGLEEILKEIYRGDTIC